MTAWHTDRAKRALDVVGAAAGLLVAAPLLALVAAVVLAVLGRPVLFRQARVGRGGRAFAIVKFRTMHNVDPARGRVDDADRRTLVGQLLRRASLDELPNLWNVLLGHMSLVGPRPLVPDDLHRHVPCPARRHEVRPGITGLAQVHGRNLLGWHDKFALDVAYVRRRSIGLDLRILAATVGVVLRRQGINPEPGAAAPDWVALERGGLTLQVGAYDGVRTKAPRT